MLCEGGKYSEVLGATSAASCLACEAGKSSAPGVTSSSSCYSVATDQAAFYNSISENGNNKMASGGEVVVSVGTFTCGTCYSSTLMYLLVDMHGTITCEGVDEGGCVQDGEGNRSVMFVHGTSGETLFIRGLSFHRGSFTAGGGLYTDDDALVTLINCVFTQNTATNSAFGGGGIYAMSGSMNVHTTNFESNTAASGNGKDIMTVNAVVTIFSTCTDGDGGSPDEREYLQGHLSPPLPPHPLTPSSFPSSQLPCRVRPRHGHSIRCKWNLHRHAQVLHGGDLQHLFGRDGPE